MRYLFAIIIIAGLVVIIVSGQKLLFVNRAAVPSITPTVSVVAPAAQPVIVNASQSTSREITRSNAESPDGTMNLRLEAVSQKGKVDYSVFAETADGQNKKLLYSPDSSQGELALSFNSWSPDNAYVFLIRKKGDATEGLVLKGSVFDITGDPLVVTRDGLTDITGWDSPTLLYVKTKVGEEKAKWWFDVTSVTFMQLQ